MPDEKSYTIIELLDVSLQITWQHLEDRCITYSMLARGPLDRNENSHRKDDPEVLTFFGQMMCGANIVARLMADILLTC